MSTGFQTPYEVKYNNCAGRILAFLYAVRESDINDNGKMLDVYQDIFRESDSQERYRKNNHYTTDTLRRQIEINDLIDEVLVEVDKLTEEDPDYGLFAKSLQSIESVRMSLSPSTDKGQLKKAFSEPVEMALFSFARRLSEDPEIERSFVTEIREMIDELMSEIESSNLPKNIKEFLFNMQSVSRSILDRYRISGSRGLKKELHKVLGEMAEVYAKDPEKEKHKKIWDTARAWVARFDALIASAEKYPAIADSTASAVDSVSKLLE